MLGEMNFTALNNYAVQPLDMSEFQAFMFDQLRTLMKEGRSPGVISGCEITPGAGLSVNISAGLIMLPDGRIVASSAVINYALDAADPTNGRIDRLEMDFTVENNRSGTNEDGDAVVVTKNHIVALSKLTGVADGNLNPQAKSAAKVSIGTIHVLALATTLSQSLINQSPKSRDLSSNKKPLLLASIANNQAAATNLLGFTFDKTKHKQVYLSGDVYREDAGQSATMRATMLLTLDIRTDEWVFIPSTEGMDTGVTFSFDQASQTIQYQSTNYGGADYLSAAKFNAEFIER